MRAFIILQFTSSPLSPAPSHGSQVLLLLVAAVAADNNVEPAFSS